MSVSIRGSVGRWEKGAVNAEADVRTVQLLLKRASQAMGDPALDPGQPDGRIARPPQRSSTVAAILAFQARFTAVSDGLIGVNGPTWKHLVEFSEKESEAADSRLLFPFTRIPSPDWTTGARRFGSDRNGGTRAHAGCDLYFPAGTAIYAISDGRVVRGPYPFYAQTFALEIDHGGFLARYGEIRSETAVRQGDTVEAGQKIARVGHLVGVSVPSDMLHLELYDKSASGPLTVDAAVSKRRSDGVPFLRRKDLIDPTPHLNDWKQRLPTA